MASPSHIKVTAKTLVRTHLHSLGMWMPFEITWYHTPLSSPRTPTTDRFRPHPTRSNGPLPVTSKSMARTPVGMHPTALGMWTPPRSHGHHVMSGQPHITCAPHRQGPPSWQTWDLRVPILLPFNLFLSYFMLMLLWLLQVASASLCSFPTWKPVVCVPVPCFASPFLPPPCRQLP